MNEARRGEVVDVVARVYAAIDDPRAWNVVVGELAALLDAQGASLFIDAGAGQEPLLASTHPLLQMLYLERYRPHDPFQAPSLVARMSQARHAFLSHELVEDRELRGSAFYSEFLLPHGNLFWGVGGNYALEDGLTVQVWAWRDKALGSFDEHDRRLANEVIPQILRAAQLGARLARLQKCAAHHDAVQDHLLDAVIVLDAHNRVVQRNARAAHLLSGASMEHGFQAKALRLSQTEQQRLAHALARAREERAAQTLRLQRQPPLPALYAVAMAVTDTHLAGTVQLFLRDPRWQQHMPEDDLIELFGLTAAQARVCAALVHGESAEDIAQRLDLRIATVRSQIKDAMEKVGLHRQSDLVRHLSLALPALASMHT